MGIYSIEEIVAYFDEDKEIFCETCANSRFEQGITLKPFLEREIEEDVVITCDCCGEVIYM